MAKRRFGKRGVGGSLEYYKGITIRKINAEIMDIGFQLRFDGWDEYQFPWYAVRAIGGVTHKLTNPYFRVYALGDYDEWGWKRLILARIKDEDPKWYVAALNRQRRTRRRREKNAI